jgi:hypothetical protein
MKPSPTSNPNMRTSRPIVMDWLGDIKVCE